MKIKLMDVIKKIPDMDVSFLSRRNDAERLYNWGLAERMSDYSEENRKVIIDCEQISAATSSFIDELFFVHLFSANFHHGNSVMVLTNVCEELYFNLIMAVEGKKRLIEIAKKKKQYFLTLDEYKAYCKKHTEDFDLTQCQIGSPYLLCKFNGQLEILGFADGEKQKELLQDMINNKARYTAILLGTKEDITNTAASNRLTRLFDKNLVFRQIISEDFPERYEYFYV